MEKKAFGQLLSWFSGIYFINAHFLGQEVPRGGRTNPHELRNAFKEHFKIFRMSE